MTSDLDNLDDNYTPPIVDNEAIIAPVEDTLADGDVPNDTKTVDAPVYDDNHYLDYFSTKLGSKFSSFDDIKSRLKTPEYELEHQQRTSQLSAKEKELEETREILSQYNDPLKYFGNDEKLYKQVQLQKQYPDLNHNVLSVAVNGLENVSPLQKAILGEQLDIPGLDEHVAKELLAKHLDCDVEDLKDENIGNLTALQKALLTKKANESAKALSKYSAEIQMPQKFDPEAVRQSKIQKEQERLATLNKTWKPVLDVLNTDKVIEAFEEIEVEGKNVKNILDKFEIDDNTLKSLPEKFMQIATAANLTATPENYQRIMRKIKEEILMDNLPKFVKQIQANEAAKYSETLYVKQTHPSSTNEPRVKVEANAKAYSSAIRKLMLGGDNSLNEL
jgi:hypothetical protein